MEPHRIPDIKTAKTFWKSFKRYLITGVITIGPVMVTVFLLWKGFLLLDGILSKVVNAILKLVWGLPFLDSHSIPGLGLIALIILLVLVGWSTQKVFSARLIKLLLKFIEQIPLVNRIYKAIKQISEAILSNKKGVFQSAVLFEYPRKGIYSIGIVTCDTGGSIQDALPEDTLSVFLPTTPNPTSGYLLFIPKKDVIMLNVSVEEALKLVVSAGTISNFDENTNIEVESG